MKRIALSPSGINHCLYCGAVNPDSEETCPSTGSRHTLISASDKEVQGQGYGDGPAKTQGERGWAKGEKVTTAPGNNRTAAYYVFHGTDPGKPVAGPFDTESDADDHLDKHYVQSGRTHKRPYVGDEFEIDTGDRGGYAYAHPRDPDGYGLGSAVAAQKQADLGILEGPEPEHASHPEGVKMVTPHTRAMLRMHLHNHHGMAHADLDAYHDDWEGDHQADHDDPNFNSFKGPRLKPHTHEPAPYKPVPYRAYEASQKTAHGFEPSDEVTCRHCPFCGSGNVWGKSDGNIHCEFCGKDFTIQVQPEYPQMAQNLDGTPLDPETGAPIPGAGGPPGGGGMLEDGAPGEEGEEGEPDEGSPEDEEDQGKNSEDEAENDGSGGGLPFQSKFYLTADRNVLPLDDLINHLAIRNAPEGAQAHIVAAVKAYNEGR